MNSLVRKIVTGTIAIALWWGGSVSVLAGVLSDRIDRYPNWDRQSQLSQHDGELTYPEWFRGRWIVTSTLLEQIAPLAPEVVTPGFESNRQYINKPIEFTVQFVPTNPTKVAKFAPLNLPRLKSSLPAPQIVADRAFNGLSIATAYLGAANVKSVKIDPQNPTKQLTQLTQDRQLESFVTGFDREIPTPVGVASPLENRFISTELSQQVFRTSATIYLNTVETTTSYQFSATPTPTISATQISAIYLSPQDPDYLRSIAKLGYPVALYKYQLDLVPAIESPI
ncbi:DUF6816 family protein [Chamaesiphon sp.]|uniref:DUF6816 family protein n=1 Tax=Chamaesiphon sp. TaxID=2814140 RepID=UPI003593FE77